MPKPRSSKANRSTGKGYITAAVPAQREAQEKEVRAATVEVAGPGERLHWWNPELVVGDPGVIFECLRKAGGLQNLGEFKRANYNVTQQNIHNDMLGWMYIGPNNFIGRAVQWARSAASGIFYILLYNSTNDELLLAKDIDIARVRERGGGNERNLKRTLEKRRAKYKSGSFRKLKF